MIGQYLPNNNETATVAFRQKIYRLNSPQGVQQRHVGGSGTSAAPVHDWLTATGFGWNAATRDQSPVVSTPIRLQFATHDCRSTGFWVTEARSMWQFSGHQTEGCRSFVLDNGIWAPPSLSSVVVRGRIHGGWSITIPLFLRHYFFFL
jgi:hypothetical protein